MRIRKKKWAKPELDACSYFIADPKSYKGRWNEFFSNNNKTELEVGCGKCSFVAQKAIRNPDINYIAVDIKSDMLGVGRRNIETLFSDNGRKVSNIALVAYNVDSIDDIISFDDKIDTMYINFCNPWPRTKHKKRRLTHPTKLSRYKQFLQKSSTVFFKTDNDELFEESIEYFKESGFEISYITYDLHSSDFEGNIETEHEIMFSQQGIKIKLLIAKLIN